MPPGPMLLLVAALAPMTCVARVTPSHHHPLPVIIWHGLGDRYDADGLASVGHLVRRVHPETYVFNIRLAENGKDDQRATFLGDVDEQISSVCDQLHLDQDLKRTNGNLRVDAMGFSQGGQFLRGLVERCQELQVRSLLTFGSQHNGINQFSACGPWDLLCKAAVAAAKGRAFGDWAQHNVVPAQYYREIDPETGLGSETYLNASHFLADINNERRHKNATYKERIESLENFVMYVFENDTTAIPKESGWFAEVIEPSESEDHGQKIIVPLRERRLYNEDWLGLKTLDRRGALAFPLIRNARHMQLDDDLLESAFRQYFGPETRSARGIPWWMWFGRQRILT